MSPTAIRNFLVFVLVLVLIDIYAYKGVNTALANHSLTLRRIVRFLYWIISVGIIGLDGVDDHRYLREQENRRDHSYVFSLVALFLLFFLPKFVMRVFSPGLDDMLHLVRWGWETGSARPIDAAGESIERARFLSQLGLILAAVPFTGVLYGVTKGRRTFNVSYVPVKSDKLPAGFHGLRVVQISDMHLGSYGGDLTIVRNGDSTSINGRRTGPRSSSPATW